MMKTGLMKLLNSAIILLFISIAYAPSITADNPISVKTIYVDDDNTMGSWDGTLSQLKDTQHLINYETKNKHQDLLMLDHMQKIIN